MIKSGEMTLAPLNFSRRGPKDHICIFKEVKILSIATKPQIDPVFELQISGQMLKKIVLH